MILRPTHYQIGLVPLRVPVKNPQPPKPKRGFTVAELQQISRELRAEFPGAGEAEAAEAAAPQAAEPAPAVPVQPVSPPQPEAQAGPAPAVPSKPSADASEAAARRGERPVWRLACDWLELHRICRRARCRHAGRCRGNPVACLRGRVPLVPDAARAFVQSMMEAEELDLPFEEAFEAASGDFDAYAAWLAGLAAGQKT